MPGWLRFSSPRAKYSKDSPQSFRSRSTSIRKCFVENVLGGRGFLKANKYCTSIISYLTIEPMLESEVVISPTSVNEDRPVNMTATHVSNKSERKLRKDKHNVMRQRLSPIKFCVVLLSPDKKWNEDCSGKFKDNCQFFLATRPTTSQVSLSTYDFS